MKSGLAGYGREGECSVDLDEIIGTDLYGITIRASPILLQISGILPQRLLELHQFLKDPQSNQRFLLPEVSTGRWEFAEDAELIRLRVFQSGASGTNIFEVAFEEKQRMSLVAALGGAIEDAGLSR